MNSAAPAAIALAILAYSVAPSHADWEGTQWGMSPGEALAVLDGAREHRPEAAEIYEFDGGRYEPLVKVGHTAGGVEGEASLLFDPDGALRFVMFSPDDVTRCDSLAAALVETYGDIEPSGFGATSIYNWVEGDNVVRLTSSAAIGICNLSFGGT